MLIAAATHHGALGLGKWLDDYGAFVLGGTSLVVALLSYRRAGHALKAGGADVLVRLTQRPPGDGTMFDMLVVNRGRTATTVERFWVVGKGGARVQAESMGGLAADAMDQLDWGGPQLGAEVGGQSTARYTLGPKGTFWAMARTVAPEAKITEANMTRPVRVEVLLGNGQRVHSSWIKYDWRAAKA